MELAEAGELFKYIVSKHRLSENEACKYLGQILSGVEYLQQIRVVHRDLKPENLLLDHKKNIKIVDFGLSNLYQQGETLKTACGSPCYAAPEMIAGKRYNGAQVDIWSCGVILFAMVCGHLPFEDPNTANLYKKILAGEFKLPNYLSAEACDLLKKILVTEPEKRYTIERIRSHPWFLKNCLQGEVYAVGKAENCEGVFTQMGLLGLNAQQAREALAAGKHNAATAAFRILLHMQRQGKRLPETTRLKRTMHLSEVPAQAIQSCDRPDTRTRTYRNSASPVAYRPGTSYNINPSLLPAAIVPKNYKRQTPRVKTPINYILDLTNALTLSVRNRSPRLGTTLETKRHRDIYIQRL